MLKFTVRYSNSTQVGIAYFAPEHVVAVVPSLQHAGESGILTTAGLSFDVTESPEVVARMCRDYPVHH